MKPFNFSRLAFAIIPLSVFLIAKAFAFYITTAGNCWSGFGPDCWVRWDSALYLDVAQNGHNLFHCGPEQGYPPGATDWCGNAGWAPLYPFFISIVHFLTSISMPVAGIGISAFFFLGFLFVIGQIIEIKDFSIKNWLIVALVAFAPGNIYFHAVFPLAQTAFFLSLLILFLQRNKFLLAGLAGFLAVMSYSIGFILIAVLCLHAASIYFQEKKIPFPLVLKTIVPALFGFVFMLLYDHFATGHWNAMFLIQAKYGHTLNSPLKMFGQHLNKLFTPEQGMKTMIEIQTFYMVFHALLLAALSWKRGSKQFRIFSIAYMLLFWFIPFCASLDVALYRNAAVFAPANTELKHFPVWALGLLLILFVFLSYFMGILFIQSILV